MLKWIRKWFEQREAKRVREARRVQLECAITAVARAVHPGLSQSQINAICDRMDVLEAELKAL